VDKGRRTVSGVSGSGMVCKDPIWTAVVFAAVLLAEAADLFRLGREHPVWMEYALSPAPSATGQGERAVVSSYGNLSV
jgi:hypothetical protein